MHQVRISLRMDNGNGVEVIHVCVPGVTTFRDSGGYFLFLFFFRVTAEWLPLYHVRTVRYDQSPCVRGVEVLPPGTNDLIRPPAILPRQKKQKV